MLGARKMKINDIKHLQGMQKYQQINPKDQQMKQKTNKKDQLSISEEAKALLEQAKEPVRGDRVAELQQQIESGTYTIDERKVAEKMLKWFQK